MKILIIKPSSLGDIIHGLQIAQALREQVPSCTIHWVARDIFADLPELATCVDKVILFRRKRGWRAIASVCSAIRRERYDWVLDMQGLLRSGIMCFAARARHKVGRADGREGATLFYKSVGLPSSGLPAHALEILKEFLPAMGLERAVGRPLQFSNLPDPATVDSRLATTQPVVLIPHSRGVGKEWHGFEALAGHLLEYGVPVVWDTHLEMATLHDQHPLFINTSGKTKLPHLVSLLGGARLVIANDSGPMHLAAALGVPVLGLFGPTSPDRFGPYPAGDSLHHVICAPGGQMAALQVHQVAERVHEILNLDIS